MKKTLFKATNTHRANLHCHTTVSDGRKTPEETKEMYARQGYGIVAFTDHNKMVAHHELSDENFLAITALEVDRSGTGGKTYHINLYATREDMVDTPPLMRMDYSDKSAINAYLAERVAEGYLACYNHPSWSMQDFTDYANLENLWGMEIANFNCDTEGLYGISPQIYDEMLRNNGALFCVGTDDNHNAAPKDDSFGAWTVVNSPDLRYESVIKSLKDGDFYASTGPEIHEITIEDDIVTIKCSP
ncbi:MAG: PHP domain-containing protein, partial [Oscillospiraceae bacterium]|nr:PHP domain-containing protein [Oscillospiraceae bacterium]